MNIEIIKEDELEAGDILLCYSSQAEGKAEELKNGYSHAAICTLKNHIVESSQSGVNKTNISTLLDEYDHIAVLRNNELWSENRLVKLDDFLTRKIGLPFNKVGMHKVPNRKKEQEIKETHRIEDYFEGQYKPPSHDRSIYFCSELITSAFIDIGIIQESASIILSPDTFSPEDIGRDKAFGFFTGYIVSYQEYNIPNSDMFLDAI